MSSMQDMIMALLGTNPKDRTCAYCKKPEPENPTPEERHKQCSRCHAMPYCSRECQKAHWKLGHKTQCALGALAKNVYLDACRSEEEAMDQLIDAYRLRVEDDCMWRGESHGLYAGDDPLDDFQSFLDLAESKPQVLPKWWNKEKRRVCEQRAVNRNHWSCIAFAVEKSDIQEHYGEGTMPMTLRMLADQIYGSGL